MAGAGRNLKMANLQDGHQSASNSRFKNMKERLQKSGRQHIPNLSQRGSKAHGDARRTGAGGNSRRQVISFDTS